MRARLAQRAFEHTAEYDAYVAQYFAALNGLAFPGAISLPLSKALPLSYGENPHQQAALYRLAGPRLAEPGLADLEQLGGDALSYNNLLDVDSAYALVADFDEPAVAIVKHNNPCGAGTGATLAEAYRKAYQGDPLSAFGGVVAANRPVDAETARAMRGILYWVVVAPAYDGEALRVLRRYKRQLRILQLPVPPRAPGEQALPGFRLHYRPVLGGFLVQTRDAVPLSAVTFTTVSRRAPTEPELADLRFAWRVVKHVRSNASVFARQGAVVGVGAGQMSRLDSVVAATHVARRTEVGSPTSEVRSRAGDVGRRTSDLGPGGGGGRGRPAEGCVMATDGYFAHPDAVEAAAEAGVTAIAHPGGGKQDEAAAATADRYDIAMVVTGYRHFRH
jgi:phosphoribosylaminoimidazolecarboxamide formyltransferase/IMP cyclohydrolase